MIRHSLPACGVALAAVLLSACASKHESASKPAAPAPAAVPEADPARVAAAEVVLLIKDAESQGGSKFHTWTAKTVRILKAPAGYDPPQDLHFAMYGWEPEVPKAPTIVYFMFFDAQARKDLRAFGWPGDADAPKPFH